jgi:hypothetical protein
MPKSFCISCNKTFSSVGNFDRHRVGKHGGSGSDARRCMTESEMLADGMRLVDGVWKGETLSDAQKAKLFAKNT